MDPDLGGGPAWHFVYIFQIAQMVEHPKGFYISLNFGKVLGSSPNLVDKIFFIR